MSTKCNLGKGEFPWLCCCKCSMHIPIVNNVFRHKVVGWGCIGMLVASRGDAKEFPTIENCKSHGMCELFMDKDKDPLSGFFKKEERKND